jgi:hypothetical protein
VAEAGRYIREVHPTLDEMMAPLAPAERDEVYQRIDVALGRFVGPTGFESPNRVVVGAGVRATEPTIR